MKQKCSFILKASMALILALVMLFGTVATSLAAVVDDLVESGWNTTDDGIKGSFKINTSGGTVEPWNVSGLKNTDGWQDFELLDAGTYEYGIMVNGTFQKSKSGDSAFSDSNGYNYKYFAHSDGGANFSSNFPAGQYVFHLDEGSNSYAGYYLYRKKAYYDGSVTTNSSAWEQLLMTYTGDGVYQYSFVGNGVQHRFRPRFVDAGTTTIHYPASNIDIHDLNSYSSGAETTTTTSTYSGSNYFYFDTKAGCNYTVYLKNNKVWLTHDESSGFSLWGGEKKEFGSKEHLAALTLNDSTGLYDGEYTFTNTNWNSFLISASDSTSTFSDAWTSFADVGWSLASYNAATVYQGYPGYHKETMSDGLLSFVEITNSGSVYGIKLAARSAGTTVKLSYDPTSKILWMYGDDDSDKALIYAKDGCINEARDTSRVIGTTTVSGSDVSNISRQTVSGKDDNNNLATITCYTSATATKGKDITVTTTISSTFASKYLVKGWDVNGDTYGIDPVAVGNDYSATFTVPDADKVEITPIYWLKNGNVTTFFVKDFNKVPDEWGGALYYYFWGGSQVTVDDEVRYPGQPFVHYGGQYYAQVPTDVTGITLNNAVWDTIHGQQIMGVGGSESSHHYQTYDYDNFAKIAAEKTNINSIYFTFKYETVKNNFENNSGSSTRSITLADFGENGNGWEDYIDPLGRPNNILGGTTVTDGGKVLYAVSNGYVRNYQGNLATEWSIYVAENSSAATANYVTTIPSSALVLDAEADFAKTAYSSRYTPALSDYSDEWNTLNGTEYKTLPVKITYEKAVFGGWSLITNNGTCPDDAGGKDEAHKDLANRMDGKWDYILNTDYSTADIRIEYSNDNGATYSTDAFNAGTNQGGTTEATAFFNNTGASYVDKHEVTSNDHVLVSTTNKYKLKTVPAPSTGYQFVGWYRLDNNSETPEFITSSTEAESLMSAKATFIARYKHVTAGNLVINHNVDGAGTATNHTVKVEVFEENADVDNDPPIKTFTGESVPLNSTYIRSDSTYKLRVTLTAIADASSYIANSSAVPTVACSQAAATYYKNPVYTRTGRFDNSEYPQNVVTTVDIFTISSLYTGDNQDFTVLNYTTTFNKLPTYTINYKYHGRQSGENYLNFARTITLSPDEAEGKNSSGADYSGNNGTALRPTYITTESDGLINDITANAPDKNDLETDVFNKVIRWSMENYKPDTATDSAVTLYALESDPTYTLTYTYYNESGVEQPAQTVSGFYNDLITLDGNNDTFATAAVDNEGNKFAYWADEDDNPLTGTKEYKMRLIDNVTIHPVYGNPANGWNSAIDKITRTHETSDNSDNVFTDFALRFTGFDSSGKFIHINPDHLNDYTVGVAVVYDTAGNNTTLTTDQISGSEFYKLSETTKYKTAAEMVQLLVDNNKTSARLREVSDTTYVTRYEATNSNLTNFNRIDLAVKYNYSQNYKRYYDAYAYILDKSNNSVIAVSPVKSGYLYDGKLPVGIN